MDSNTLNTVLAIALDNLTFVLSSLLRGLCELSDDMKVNSSVAD